MMTTDADVNIEIQKEVAIDVATNAIENAIDNAVSVVTDEQSQHDEIAEAILRGAAETARVSELHTIKEEISECQNMIKTQAALISELAQAVAEQSGALDTLTRLLSAPQDQPTTPPEQGEQNANTPAALETVEAPPPPPPMEEKTSKKPYRLI